MGSFNRGCFCDRLHIGGVPSLIVEGIAITPEFQGKGIFGDIANEALGSDEYLCLRTQNPFMYKALSDFCYEIYPNGRDIPKHIMAMREEFAKSLGCDIDKNGVIKGYYGGLFYGEMPHHEKVDPLFKQLGVDLSKGDALLVIGQRTKHGSDVL